MSGARNAARRLASIGLGALALCARGRNLTQRREGAKGGETENDKRDNRPFYTSALTQ